MACPYKWYSTVVIIRRLTIALSEVQASDIPNEIPGFTKKRNRPDDMPKPLTTEFCETIISPGIL